jgi:hydrogenase maturation protease
MRNAFSQIGNGPGLSRVTIVVIGIGNPDRGDDAAGREVARRLRATGLKGAEIFEHEGEATALLARLERARAAIIIDACVSDAAPGTVRRFDAVASSLPSGARGGSSHGFGLCEAIELARALGALPPRCFVYAIEGERFEIHAPMSKCVSEAVEHVAECVRAEIATFD